MKEFLYNKKSRGVLLQGLFIIFVISGFYFFASNAAKNLASQGIASGFSFLDETAGFAIIQSIIPYSEESSYLSAFFVGLLNTLLVSFVGIILASILGLTVGISRLSNNYLLSKVAGAYIEVIRNIPLLLQIFFWYFVVLRSLPSPKMSVEFFGSVFINNRGVYIPWPSPGENFSLLCILLIGFLALAYKYKKSADNIQKDTGVKISIARALAASFIFFMIFFHLFVGPSLTFSFPSLRGFNFQGGATLIPEFVALLLSLVIYTGAFIGEIVRAGIQAVPKGQVEAAEALGLKRGVILRKVIIPQALRVIIPPVTSQYLNLTKNSSLAAAIGYPELVSVFAGTVLNQTGQAVEVILITMSVYMAISLIISFGMNVYNQKKAIIER